MEFGEFSTVNVSERGSALLVSINRPRSMNALSTQVVADLDAVVTMCSQLLETASESGWPFRAVIITGEGEKAFAAGADIVEMSEYGSEEARAYAESMHQVTLALEALPVPVIAAVNGHALGGGCELALACDWIIASENASFGQPEITLGIIPGFGGCVRLPRRVPLGVAREMILTGNPLRAQRALEVGLVNCVCPDKDALLECADELVASIAQRSPVAVAQAKLTMAKADALTVRDGLDVELGAFSAVFGSEDSRVGRQAFVDKQTAQFPGR
ncbi:enoyl-CoA hydratase-related protein [Pseudoglutamicibacter albus]|uniref:enoyl-CoA hydratase/isomerase family protein n=1 Tax=Pseudoglutamicibacter albus TaxID=98671 RepID=UPI001EF6E7E4|nr:enoyl-CoA hydratase-related protein [Pseudoglutamicibacter albus]MCG7305036.1 enoyl-CoA hydratase-related protein [Pseudoglutamicibacter albus]